MSPKALAKKKNPTRFLSMGIIFGLLAIFFVVMHYFNVIKTLDLFLTVTYVVYFVGLALLYNAAYCKTKNYRISKIISNIVGSLFILVAIVMLIYGFSTGTISIFG